MEFAEYQRRLEKQHGQPIEQIMRDTYVEKDYGPATGAQALSIPRQVFMHFIHEFNLKPDKLKRL
ncbi:hypothetical protein BHE17_12020 [Planococcus maritimus]|uniref:hypothetical protein n=1 Tax=Planococcus maritimus TaxID=192421 RepID=UPI00084BDFE4|nr:hypothetical protein [Planococcus maritimus]OED33137.1 hypothetical protein BHE17_12020 [Planococcus maritimus]